MAIQLRRLRKSQFIDSFSLWGNCHLFFSTTSILTSGHNRWSKIKHEKGAADAKKNRVRSSIAGELTLASKCNYRVYISSFIYIFIYIYLY